MTPGEASAEAAAKVRPRIGRQQANVLAAIMARGAACCDEVEQDTGMSHQSASARMNELAKKELIVPAGCERRTRQGGIACAWRVA